MTDLKIYTLIHKRLTNSITDAELQELKSLESNPSFEKINQEVSSIWIASKDYYPNKSFDVEAAKMKFKKKIASDIPSPLEETLRTKPSVATSQSKTPWLAIAIGMLGLVLVSYLAYQFLSNSNDGYQKVTTEQTDQNLQYALLKDNTEVWLNEGSELLVGDLDKGGVRSISLRGEAFFKVEHDVDRPFVVDMGNDNFVEVLGTSFNIITDTGDNSAKVDVKQGSVRVFNNKNSKLSTIVTAGEYAIINNKKAVIESEHNPVIYSLLGTSLSFRESVLVDVFANLESVYNVKIDHSLAICMENKFTSPLLDDYSVDEVMDIIITNFSGLKSVKTESGFVVTGSACD